MSVPIRELWGLCQLHILLASLLHRQEKDGVTGSKDEGGAPAARVTRLAMALGPVTQSLDDQQALYITWNPGKP